MNCTQYSDNRIWISRILESKYPFKIKNPVLSSLIKFGLPTDVAFFIFYMFRSEYISAEFLVGYILAVMWINIGPYLIWYYNQQLTKKFFDRIMKF